MAARLFPLTPALSPSAGERENRSAPPEVCSQLCRLSRGFISMSKKANPTFVGLFIVLGLALGLVGLIIFSSGKLFSKQQRFILYFNASLKGLNPGAPVKLRGVT